MNIDARLQDAVQYVWTGRLKQREKQAEAGKVDAGTRGDVTGGRHMGALEVLVKDLLVEFGIREEEVFTRKKLELPGHYRSTKKWDLLVVSREQLVPQITIVGPPKRELHFFHVVLPSFPSTSRAV